LLWIETGGTFVEIFVLALGRYVSQESMCREFVTDYATSIDNDISERVGCNGKSSLEHVTRETFGRIGLFARFAREKLVPQCEEQAREYLANFGLISHDHHLQCG
jgi:hypothetical protein